MSSKGYKHTVEARKRISAALSQRVILDKTRKKLSENKIGRKLSEQTREKLSVLQKGLHRSPKTEFAKGNRPWFADNPERNPLKNPTTEIKIKRKQSLAVLCRVREKAPNWKGGLSFIPYCSKFNRRLKEKIRDRDNRTCQLCGIKENGKKLSVHHVHYDKENCEPDLVALCCNCNTKVNCNRDYWESYFMAVLFWRNLL